MFSSIVIAMQTENLFPLAALECREVVGQIVSDSE